MLSLTKNKKYKFKALDKGKIEIKEAVWTGDILKWVKGTAVLKMKDINEEGVYYFVPDNLIIQEK